jgi:transcription antitermination factor NusG
MRDVQDEIQDLVNQLQQLNIQQSHLLRRLERLSEGASDNNPTPPPQIATARRAPPVTVQHFAVGDRVRIRNPGILQPTTGTVTKITPKRITIQAHSGTRVINIVRAPKNVILE